MEIALYNLLNRGRMLLQRRDLFRLSGYAILGSTSGALAKDTEGNVSSSSASNAIHSFSPPVL